jgi:uncharacterized protein (DUF169 family)
MHIDRDPLGSAKEYFHTGEAIREKTMDALRKLENVVGGVWHGVTFYDQTPECPQGTYKAKGVRFCEATVVARVHKVLMDPHEITCRGAKFAFGYGGEVREEMIRNLREKGYAGDDLERILEETPCLAKPPAAIGLDVDNPPDIAMAALVPDQAMRLTQLYEKKRKKPPSTTLSSVMSICANIAVRSLQEGDLVLSFGCEDARAFGGIPRERLVAGMPYALAQSLV